MLQKEVFIEEDISKNCSNYPNEYYTTYDECDEYFIRTNLGDLYGPNYVPLWSTQDKQNVTGLTEIPYSLQNWYKYQPSGEGGTRSPPATPQRLQNLIWPPGGPKMADGIWKGVYP